MVCVGDLIMFDELLQSFSETMKAECDFVIWKKQSGRRDSNPRPSAWKANALSTELLPLLYLNFLEWKCGESRIRTYEGVRQQIYSLPQLAALVSPQII